MIHGPYNVMVWESKSTEMFTILLHKGVTEIGRRLKDRVQKSVWVDSSQPRLDCLIKSLIHNVFFSSKSIHEDPSIMLGAFPRCVTWWRRS